jgi:hypothetical protein
VPYSAAFRAYLERPGPHKIASVLEITWPGSTAPSRFGIADFPTAADFYEGRIQQGGIQDSSEGVDAKSSSLEPLESTLTAIDATEETDKGTERYRKLQRILEGAVDPRRSPATLLWASPDLARADWSVRLAGILDRWQYHDSGLIDLTIRTDDRWMQSGASRWPILKSEWPDCPDANLSIYLPVIYGTHISTNLSGRGFVPTIMVVDGSNRVDFVSLGFVTVTPVWRIRAGTPTEMTGGGVQYTVTQEVVGGKAVTLIRWEEAGGMLDSDIVQCDVQGLSYLGGGTGVQITNPVAQIRHWLVNFAAPIPWLSGTYNSELLIEPTSWAVAEAYAQRFHLEGSFRVGGAVDQRSVMDIFNEWLGTWRRFRPYWTPEGKLAMGVLTYDWPGQGTGSHFDLVRERDVINRLAVKDDPSTIISRISATHLFDIAGNKNYGSMDVEDPSRSEKVTETVRMTHSVSKFG